MDATSAPGAQTTSGPSACTLSKRPSRHCSDSTRYEITLKVGGLLTQSAADQVVKLVHRSGYEKTLKGNQCSPW